MVVSHSARALTHSNLIIAVPVWSKVLPAADDDLAGPADGHLE